MRTSEKNLIEKYTEFVYRVFNSKRQLSLSAQCNKYHMDDTINRAMFKLNYVVKTGGRGLYRWNYDAYPNISKNDVLRIISEIRRIRTTLYRNAMNRTLKLSSEIQDKEQDLILNTSKKRLNECKLIAEYSDEELLDELKTRGYSGSIQKVKEYKF